MSSFVEVEAIIEQYNMCFKSIFTNDYIILMYTRFFLHPSWCMHRFLNEIQEYISGYILDGEVFITVIDTIIVVVPDSNDFGSVILHFLVEGVIMCFYKLVFDVCYGHKTCFIVM